MFKKISFHSQSEMNFLPKDDLAIAISITNSGMNNINLDKFRDALFLKFDNIESTFQKGLRFSRTDAANIKNFIKKYEDSDIENIYINCLMGESRSAAIAKFLSEHYEIKLEKEPENMLEWVYSVMERIYR